MKIKRKGIIASYSFIAALLYLIFAIFEILGYIAKQDIFGGLSLIVISTTFFAGIKEIWNGDYKGLSFTLGASILASIFGIMYLLILLADYLEWIIGNSSMPSYIHPEIILWLVIIPLIFITYNEVKK